MIEICKRQAVLSVYNYYLNLSIGATKSSIILLLENRIDMRLFDTNIPAGGFLLVLKP